MKPEEVKPGDILYVPSSLYISHGKDDILGGKATVKTIFKSNSLPESHYNYYMVSFHRLRKRTYNLRHLLERQNELKKQFGVHLAHEDPDYR